MATAPPRPYTICRWKECRRPPIKGGVLCEVHTAEVLSQSKTTIIPFLKALPIALGIGVAGNALYAVCEIIVRTGLLNRYVGSGSQFGEPQRLIIDKKIADATELFCDLLEHHVGEPEFTEIIRKLQQEIIVPRRSLFQNGEPK
jgi:hypothetical protein